MRETLKNHPHTSFCFPDISPPCLQWDVGCYHSGCAEQGEDREGYPRLSLYMFSSELGLMRSVKVSEESFLHCVTLVTPRVPPLMKRKGTFWNH